MISGPAGRSLLGLIDRKMIFQFLDSLWIFPYVWGEGGSAGGPFPYVFTIV